MEQPNGHHPERPAPMDEQGQPTEAGVHYMLIQTWGDRVQISGCLELEEGTKAIELVKTQRQQEPGHHH